MKRTANILRKYRQDIILSWEKVVKEEVAASRATSTTSLHNHLPELICDISDIFMRKHNFNNHLDDDKYEEIIEHSIHHGRDRANSKLYTVKQIIHEYIILHRIISKKLIEENAYSQEVADLLKYIMETAILESAGSFSNSLQETQEKLIGTLSHDIRNPLSAAQVALEMLHQDDDDKEWFDKMKTAAARSIKKALNLIEGLMDGVTVKAGEGLSMNFKKQDIVEIVRLLYEETSATYVKEVQFECPEKKIVGVFDEIAISRLLDNLITNAIKHGSPTSPITIKITDGGEDVHLIVKNDGDPIPDHKKGHIYDFLNFSNDGETSYRSWGMGLTLVKLVAEAHGGSVNMESSLDDGTTFTIVISKNHNKPGKRRVKLNDGISYLD